MSYIIKNKLGHALKISSFLWNETIPAGTWHYGDKTSLSGGDFDITLSVVSGYIFLDPTLISTQVSKDKETIIEVTGEHNYRNPTTKIWLTITDKEGRREEHEVTVGVKER
jgi:hypothetical protein